MSRRCGPDAALLDVDRSADHRSAYVDPDRVAAETGELHVVPGTEGRRGVPLCLELLGDDVFERACGQGLVEHDDARVVVELGLEAADVCGHEHDGWMVLAVEVGHQFQAGSVGEVEIGDDQVRLGRVDLSECGLHGSNTDDRDVVELGQRTHHRAAEEVVVFEDQDTTLLARTPQWEDFHHRSNSVARGMVRVMRVPRPGSLWISRFPPPARTAWSTRVRPIPFPCPRVV